MKLILFLLSGFFTITGHAQPSNPDFSSLPELKWEFKTGKSIYSSPVISGNQVFFGGLDSALYAVDLTTGNENWRFRTKGEIRSTVCINGNNLYLNGGDGKLYSLDVKTGKLHWTFKTKGEKKYDFADYFHSSPVFFKDRIYFGSGDGNMYALHAKTGKMAWSFQTLNIVHTTPAIDHGKLFFGSFDGQIYALSASTGKLIWSFKTVGHRYFPIGEVQGSPFAFNGLVFIGARDYNVYALDQEKGFCHWNKAFTRGWGLNPTVNDSVLYIGSADERVLISADPSTGHENWKLPMEFLIFGNNAFTDSILVVGTTIGKLHGIGITDGKKKWSFETGSYLANRSKYFKPDDTYRDDIYSIIRSNEHFLEVECELGGIFSTPVISGNLILFTSTNGSLYCLKGKGN